MGKINEFFIIRYARCINCAISVVFLFCSSFCFATDCKAPVQPIKMGQVSVCDGFLFSPDAESKAYKATRIAELQKEENEILNRRLDLYVKQSDSLAKQLAQKETTDQLYRTLYFIGGALITGFIASNVRH